MKTNETTLAENSLVFPSHNHTPCQNKTLVDLGSELIASAQDTNNILAQGNIHFLVRSHYVNTATGDYGIESLIKRILSENGSIFPMGIENSELRQVAIAGGMTTDGIIRAIRNTFGSDRYPDATVRMYLSPKGLSAKNSICKIQMTSKEDKNRTCSRPRCKWYLNASLVNI